MYPPFFISFQTLSNIKMPPREKCTNAHETNEKVGKGRKEIL